MAGEIKKSGYGQIEQIFRLFRPQKIRVSGRFIPDFTIDMTKPSTGPGILSVIKPKVSILFPGDIAVEYEYGSNRVKAVDPRVFLQETTFDKLQKLGWVFLGFIITGAAMYIVYKIRRK